MANEKAMTPLKAIREKCLDCSCGNATEVARCTFENCPLWPMRMGKNPYRKTVQYTEEEKQEIAQRLANGRRASKTAQNPL